MKKMNFFVMALLCLCTMAIGFVACSDDDDNSTVPNLGTPPYEAVSGKYNVTTSGSPYESIELGPAATTSSPLAAAVMPFPHRQHCSPDARATVS